MTMPSRFDGEKLGAWFERFGRVEAQATSPMYERLCEGISRDRSLLVIASGARPGQPMPNLFLASVQFVLHDHLESPLAEFYPALSGKPRGKGDPFPAFRSFALEHADEVGAAVATRLVQTNVVKRSACLLPAFGLIARRTDDQPLALVEIGTSAGLNLLWDRFHYRYGNKTVGDADSPVRIACEPRGPRDVPLPDRMPKVVMRKGIDPQPIDVRDPTALRWLRSLIWPGREEEAEQLLAVAKVLETTEIDLIAGDALDSLPDVTSDVPEGASLCVFHSCTANQWSDEQRQRLSELVESIGSRRDIYHVSLEWLGGESPVLRLSSFESSRRHDQTLATSDPHADWIEWLDPAVPPPG
jgi:hypothetical protein